MRKFNFFAAIVAALTSIYACNTLEETNTVSESSFTTPVTKALGDKTPIVACYVETNDVNPLNAGDYMLENIPFFDIVELFASNIHKETVDGQVRPTLYLNDKLTNVLENGGAATYVKPLQDKGIKVLLTVLGDWQKLGVANMTDTQADQFATILAYTVQKYGLDGIGFDDEYADYPSWSFLGQTVNNTSYTRIITKLHQLMPSDKLITVFDWGNTNTIDESVACPCIDYVYHGYFGSYRSTPGLCGQKAKWSPLSLNLGNTYNVTDVENYAAEAADGEYGALMCFNLRTRSDNDPINVLQALSDGAYFGETVSCTGGDRPRTAGSVASGYTITYSMATESTSSNN